MEHSNPELLRDPGEAGLTDQEHSEASCLEKEQTRCSPCMVTEDGITNGSWSQRSLSRSLQRAETLLRTFNPGLKWLFQGRQDEEDMERHFVVAHNLVSRSSARLLRLHQAVVTVAPQWQSVGREQTGSHRNWLESGPKRMACVTSLHYLLLSIDGCSISPSTEVRNLGVILDTTLSFQAHIKSVTKSAFYHLKNIARIQPSLSDSVAETLVHAFITSHLDYCNGVLSGVPSKTLDRLQYVLHQAMAPYHP
ncbi:uncharacterized protein [Notothenia coriiceps]|uniref:Uncharacterized protein n=1 Tax=Notothenia coriiceps TaxID=8208 RepID=A0A6I9NPJ9_9TELE|nr:PREDICTED: uncharacterized protein LOC104951859 [Notothenia coriiceps]